jgi:integrase
MWTVPEERMKARKEWRTPLSDRAVAILEEMKALRGDDPDSLLFPGARNRPLSGVTPRLVLERMGHKGVTAHGFRSSFRDWAIEKTDFPSEAAELALAHTVGSKVELSYRRGDLLERRRKLAEAWSDYCMTVPAAKVLKFG